MKSRFMNRIVSVLLVMVMILSMLTISLAGTSAAQTELTQTSGLGTSLAKKAAGKLLEQTQRKICDLTLELGESVGGEAGDTIESFAKWFLMDASEAAAYDAKQLCYDILDELVVTQGMIEDYTREIYSGQKKQNAYEAKMALSQKWTDDVSDVLNGKYNNSGNVLNSFNAYYKYFLITQLHQTGLPTDKVKKAALDKIWEETTGLTTITEADITEAKCKEAKSVLDNSFRQILTGSTNTDDDTFGKVNVNIEFTKAIETLTDNLIYESVSNSDFEFTVVETAAEYAFYALPFSHQQYEFVNSFANKQAFVIMILQMTYNEFLSQQSEYLKQYYEDHPPESGTWNTQVLYDKDGNGYTYDTLRSDADYYLGYSGEEIAKLYDTRLDVNITAYNSSINYDMTLAHYMKPEDAVVDTLSINGFESSHNYKNELNDNSSYTHIDNNSHISNATYTSSNMDFCRVMSGNTDHKVYYILSPQQFTASDATLIGIVDHNVSRGETDLVDLYGNIHLTSCDYRNMIKDMSDGTNTFSCPSSDEISGTQGSLFELFDTPAFVMNSNSQPSTYLSDYIPSKSESNSFILTSTYKHDFSGGAAIPKYADIWLVDSDSALDTTQNVTTGKHNFEDIKYNANGRKHSYALIVENNADTYLQKANMSVDDKASTIESFEIKNMGNTLKNDEILSSETQGYVAVGNNATIKPGNRISIRFKLSNDGYFSSLKAVRNNKEETAEVLIADYDELKCFEKTEDGYYEFNYNMPYSDTTFVLTTERKLEEDDQGRFVIQHYEDLYDVAEKVNAGLEEYVNGSYIVANDITFPDNMYWTDPIGVNDTVYSTSSSTFRGEFDGQGYTIRNLKIKNGDTVHNHYGLFGQLSGGEIKNLNLENVTVDCTANYYGTIAGSMNDSHISMCTVSGSINVPKLYHAGGMVGRSYDSTIEKCINYADIVSSAYYVGGICGTNNGTVNNCANFGEITANKVQRAGGIVGGDVSDNTVTNCFNAGNVSGSAEFEINSVAGYANTCVNNYYLDTTGTDNRATPKTLEQFKSGEVAHLLNKNVAIPAWAWFQNLDNGKTPDDFPTLNFTRDNVVLKVNREDRTYSNIPNKFLLGDADLDGSVTIMDATIIQMHCAQLYELTGMALVNADTTKDKTISISDATRIQAYIAGILKEL